MIHDRVHLKSLDLKKLETELGIKISNLDDGSET
jgi:hypothetical protein